LGCHEEVQALIPVQHRAREGGQAGEQRGGEEDEGRAEHGVVIAVRSKKGKQELLFVNKKKQKNFNYFCAGLFQRRAKRSKSFLVLFFKKELLACLNVRAFHRL
jgi:hypothetical protein